MSDLTIKAARSSHAELLARRAKLDQKKRDCESLAAGINSKLSGLEAAHSILEKRYLTDEVDLTQVTSSRNEIGTKRAELAEAERLASLAADAIQEIDAQIQQAEQEISAAQREFCTEQRNQALAKIKADASLRKNLIAAMVANANTGLNYTFSPPAFFSQFVNQLIPEIQESEIRTELDKFNKSNDLTD